MNKYDFLDELEELLAGINGEELDNKELNSLIRKAKKKAEEDGFD